MCRKMGSLFKILSCVAPSMLQAAGTLQGFFKSPWAELEMGYLQQGMIFQEKKRVVLKTKSDTF